MALWTLKILLLRILTSHHNRLLNENWKKNVVLILKYSFFPTLQWLFIIISTVQKKTVSLDQRFDFTCLIANQNCAVVHAVPVILYLCKQPKKTNQIISHNIIFIFYLQVFFFKAQYVSGSVKLNLKELEQYVWVTKEEMKQYVSNDYYNAIAPALMDQLINITILMNFISHWLIINSVI